MPAGLLNPLTLDQDADLFAYLGATPGTPTAPTTPVASRQSTAQK